LPSGEIHNSRTNPQPGERLYGDFCTPTKEYPRLNVPQPANQRNLIAACAAITPFVPGEAWDSLPRHVAADEEVVFLAR
jgi:hypothetical protein